MTPRSAESARAYKKRWYLANKERAAEYQRQYRIRESKQRWYLSNPAKVAAQRERLRAIDPIGQSAIVQARNHRRRERIAMAPGPRLETASIVAVLSYGTGLYASFVAEQGSRIYYVGALAKRLCEYCMTEAPLTIDHLVALSRGGANDLLNLVAACKACNASKHSKTPIECSRWLSVSIKRAVA